jgi:hypothetical protein
MNSSSAGGGSLAVFRDTLTSGHEAEFSKV